MTASDRMADLIRAEARRRYLNEPLHRAQVTITERLVIEPDMSPEGRQLARASALVAASLALVVADTEFMATVASTVETDESQVQLMEQALRTPPLISDEQRKQLLFGDWTTDTQPDLH